MQLHFPSHMHEPANFSIDTEDGGFPSGVMVDIKSVSLRVPSYWHRVFPIIIIFLTKGGNEAGRFPDIWTIEHMRAN